MPLSVQTVHTLLSHNATEQEEPSDLNILNSGSF